MVVVPSFFMTLQRAAETAPNARYDWEIFLDQEEL